MARRFQWHLNENVPSQGIFQSQLAFAVALAAALPFTNLPPYGGHHYSIPHHSLLSHISLITLLSPLPPPPSTSHHYSPLLHPSPVLTTSHMSLLSRTYLHFSIHQPPQPPPPTQQQQQQRHTRTPNISRTLWTGRHWALMTTLS